MTLVRERFKTRAAHFPIYLYDRTGMQRKLWARAVLTELRSYKVEQREYFAATVW